MIRSRLYPQITRQGPARLSQWEATYNSQPLHAAGMTPFTRDRIRVWTAQIGHGRKTDKMIFNPEKNGDNHATSIMCVVDLLLRVDHDSYTYPAGLTEILIRDYGHLVQWDTYTVGRILSGLLGASPLLDKEHAAERPLQVVHWGGARRIFVNATSYKAWRWLGEVRDRIGKQAERDRADARQSNPVRRDAGVWDCLDGIDWNTVG